jgi:anti-anti-sigma factor
VTTPEVPSALRIEEDHAGALTVFGELDLASAPQLATALDRQIASTEQDVVLDLGGLQFCDSTGLSVFVDAHRNLQAVGRRLILRDPSARVYKLLATTKLDQVLEID